MTTAGGPATSDPWFYRAPPPLAGGQRLRAEGQWGRAGVRAANLDWPAAATALNGGRGTAACIGSDGLALAWTASWTSERSAADRQPQPPRPAGPYSKQRLCPALSPRD